MLKRLVRRLFSMVEIALDGVFGQANNPLASLGSLGWFFFWIAAVSGIYLYIFFDTGITRAYASVEYITHQQWYAAGVMRSLHRYSSDGLVVIAFLHLLREFSLDRLRGKRFFAWITGVPLLAFIYICGISGYWLVWDKLAQFIAIATAEWLDVLPIFGQPIANNFLNSETLGNRFFTLMVFIHIFAPLFMLLLMWVHIQRHTRSRVNPPRPLAIGTGVAILALSLIVPATSQGPADLDTVPVSLDLDWFYLFAYPLIDITDGGTVWLALFAGTLLLLILPWLPPRKPAPAAVVDLDNCNGCARCFDDCPYSAITMVPRSDGKSFETEAVVNVANCMSCGICVGACPTSTPFRRATAIVPGIELPDHGIAQLRQTTLEKAGTHGSEARVIVYACESGATDALLRDGVEVISMPCVAMLPPSFIDFALSRQLADGIMLAGCAEADCRYRLGDEWTRRRMAGERDPYLRKRVDRRRLALSWERSRRAQRRALDAFVDQLGELPRNGDRDD